MGVEYKILVSPMDQERFVEHIKGLPFMRTFDPKRNSYALFSPKSQGTAFAYVAVDESAIHFTDVLTEVEMANRIFRGLIDLALLHGGRVVVEEE